MISFDGKTNNLTGKKKSIKLIIRKIIDDHNKKLKNVEYIMMSDDELLEINIQALKHNYYTDIITFDYSQDELLEGEIYISIDRVKDNAKEYFQEFHVELLRVIFHGILHMVGYKDKTPPEKKKMRQMEEYYLKEYQTIVPRGTI